ncbi:MAG: hypothetical protein R8G66_27255 [Cytophagales bacterium]|nr:hypothetical protein [Cytophagales bacterium]
MVKRNNSSIITILRRYSKVITAFLVVNFITSMVYPLASFALTSGPTAPEYTSFEPVDTTDLVNLLTGDMVYNIPLLEIPGPAGGYPLSLSNHAGIQPNEEASWVGLGWTLNPGSISRTVNGYPDDQKEAVRTRRDYHTGGTTNVYSVGIGIPGINFGVSVSQDTYQGLGVGQSLGFGLPIPGPVSVGLTMGHDGYGNGSTSANAGLRIGKSSAESSNLTGSLGVSTNFKSVSFSGGVSSLGQDGGSYSLIGASIGSKGLKPSVSVAGISASQQNGRANNWTTNSHGFSIPIPLDPSLSTWLTLGYRFNRYFIDEESDVNVVGTLHSQFAGSRFEADYDDLSFDSYSLVEIEKDYIEQEPEKSRGGSFPAYDQYNVTGQGISGSMRPHILEPGNLFRQNVKNGDNYTLKFLKKGRALPTANFRFINDFSAYNTYDENIRMTLQDYSIDGHSEKPSGGFYNEKLAGSKSVEHYTNQNIIDGTALNNGLILTDNLIDANRLTRYNTDLSDQVGGFKVTNESGVTYHYSLPVYAYGEYSLNQLKDKPKNAAGEIFTEYHHNEAYAYTWLLTGITGPDFVDRGGVSGASNGFLDDEDWGYWIKFDYGLWTDSYHWRNPSIGMHSDIESEYETYSHGTKEMYYLNSIESSSHVAIFEKSIRADAKSVINPAEGGFGVDRTHTTNCGDEYYDPDDIDVYDYSVASLKLDNIYLLDKDYHVSGIENMGTGAPYVFEFDTEPCAAQSDKIHFGENVIDASDLDETYGGSTLRDYLTNSSLRVIDFGYDYSLQDNVGLAGVINSFDAIGEIYNSPPNLSLQHTKLGKLTLNSLELQGKEGRSVTPPIEFSYDLQNGPVVGQAWSVAGDQAIMVENAQDIQPGDLLKTTSGSYFVVDYSADGFWFLRNIAGDNLAITEQTISFEKTKNPPYDREAFDIWGYYKSDFDSDLCNENENLARKVSDLSARSTDVWSLRGVLTSLGAEINFEYESDKYQSPVLYKHHLVSVEDYDYVENKIVIPESYPDLNSLYTVGSEIEFLYQWEYEYHLNNGDIIKYYENSQQTATIESIVDNNSSKYLTISDIPDPAGRKREEGERGCIPFYQQNSETDQYYLEIHEGNHCLYRSEEDGHYLQASDLTFVNNHTAYSTWDNERFAVGTISIPPNGQGTWGGGIKVTSVNLLNPTNGRINTTEYDYSSASASTSGATSYEPYGQDVAHYVIEFDPHPLYPWVLPKKKMFEKYVNKTLSELLQISREVPAPAVLYDLVTVREFVDDNQVSGKVEYDFQVFEEGFVEREKIEENAETVSVSIYCSCADIENACLTDNEYSCDQSLPIPCSTLQTLCENDPDGFLNETVDVNVDKIKPITIRDYSARAGSLRGVKTYDVNDKLLTETSTIFQYDLETGADWKEKNANYRTTLSQNYRNQGVIQELFSEYRIAYGDQGGHYRVFSKKEEYPVIVREQIKKDYRTGIESVTTNLGFDLFSGEVDHLMLEDQYGNQTVTKTVPAYHFYEDMGPSVNGGNNMLTQEGASYTYLMSDSFDPSTFNPATSVKDNAIGLKGASFQTWSDQHPVMKGNEEVSSSIDPDSRVWKHLSTYTFTGNSDPTLVQKDGSYALTTFSEISDVSELSASLDWQKNNEITLYDIYSHALEAQDINGNFAATKMDLSQARVYATAANAAYSEFAFSGAEDGDDEGVGPNNYGGGVTQPVGERVHLFGSDGLDDFGSGDDEKTHTGLWSVKATSGVAFNYNDQLRSGRTYRALVWCTAQGGVEFQIEVAGTSLSVSTEPLGSSNGWYLHEAVFDVDDGTNNLLNTDIDVVAVGGNVKYIDDFRVHPVDAVMTAYVYNEWGELSHVLDQNNLYMYYEYDAVGRLKSITRETFKHGPVKVSETIINYARSNN